jgi:hypothetical protein
MSTITDEQTSAYAEHIMTAIGETVAEGALPLSARTFAALHSYLDANDFLTDAGVPMPTDPGGVDAIAAVQAEVDRRLADPARPWCTYGACDYPRHDHTTTVDRDGMSVAEPIAMLCNDCGEPTHWDEKLAEYRHDDPQAEPCFLVH